MMAEQAVLRYPKGISLRLASVYGSSPEMRADRPPLLNWMVRAALIEKGFMLSGPEVVRDVIHINDAVGAFLLPIMVTSVAERMYKNAFNVGGGCYTKLELCEAIKKELPDFGWVLARAGAYSDPDQRDFAVSYDKIKALGGCWVPCCSLGWGIRDLIQAYTILR